MKCSLIINFVVALCFVSKTVSNAVVGAENCRRCVQQENCAAYSEMTEQDQKRWTKNHSCPPPEDTIMFPTTKLYVCCTDPEEGKNERTQSSENKGDIKLSTEISNKGNNSNEKENDSENTDEYKKYNWPFWSNPGLRPTWPGISNRPINNQNVGRYPLTHSPFINNYPGNSNYPGNNGVNNNYPVNNNGNNNYPSNNNMNTNYPGINNGNNNYPSNNNMNTNYPGINNGNNNYPSNNNMNTNYPGINNGNNNYPVNNNGNKHYPSNNNGNNKYPSINNGNNPNNNDDYPRNNNINNNYPTNQNGNNKYPSNDNGNNNYPSNNNRKDNNYGRENFNNPRGNECSSLPIVPPAPQTGCCGIEATDNRNFGGQRYMNRPANSGSSINPRKKRDTNNTDTENPEITLDNRIAGGKQTNFLQFPWTVFLETTFDDGGRSKPRSFNCGGSLISARYVLTAAHCVVEDGNIVSDISVVLAEYDKRTFPLDCIRRGQQQECIENVMIPAEAIIPHPQFDSRRLQNDIALIRLRTNAPYTEYIRPICLPPINVDNPQFSNLRLAAAGWGRNGTRPSMVKQATVVNLVPQRQCSMDYPYLTERHLCAASKYGADTCEGDSGGPLMMFYEGQYYVSGVVSGKRADTPCGSSTPSLYTNVYNYLDWIRQNIR